LLAVEVEELRDGEAGGVGEEVREVGEEGGGEVGEDGGLVGRELVL
jgi:hypothetical protein